MAASLRLVLVVSLFYRIGLVGTAIAYPVLYLALTMVLLSINKHLTGFRCSHAALRLFLSSSALVFSAFASNYFLQEGPALIVGALLAAIALIFSLCGIAQRLDSNHRLAAFTSRIPGISRLCGR